MKPQITTCFLPRPPADLAGVIKGGVEPPRLFRRLHRWVYRPLLRPALYADKAVKSCQVEVTCWGRGGGNQLGSCKLDPVYPTGLPCTLEETLNTESEAVLLEMHLRGREVKSPCKVCTAFSWLRALSQPDNAVEV